MMHVGQLYEQIWSLDSIAHNSAPLLIFDDLIGDYGCSYVKMSFYIQSVIDFLLKGQF